MRGIYYIIKVTVLMLMLGVMWRRFESTAEARHYSQPFGDILADEDENVYPNSFDGRNEDVRYGYRSGQGRGKGYDQAASRLGRRRGEAENSQHQNFDSNYYSRDSRTYGRLGNNGRMVSSSIVELQHDNTTDELREDMQQHKCSVWVP